MVITSNKYFKDLLSLQKTTNVDKYIGDFINSGEVSEDGIVILYENGCANKVIDFYVLLISKLHKIVQELLSENPKSACQCIKTVTSIITQSTITLEKQFDNNVLEANEFIDCVGLKELSNALYVYFSTGDIKEMEKQLIRVRNDIIFVKEHFC